MWCVIDSLKWQECRNQIARDCVHHVFDICHSLHALQLSFSNAVWQTLILPWNKTNVNCESAVICKIICIQKVWWLILCLMRVDKRPFFLCQHYLLYDPLANQNLKGITQKWSFWHHLLSLVSFKPEWLCFFLSSVEYIFWTNTGSHWL